MQKTKTLKVRVRDKHAKLLAQMARSVNFVWNYLNELSQRSISERQRFLSAYDLQKYTNGSAKPLGLYSHTVQEIGKEYVARRKQFKKIKLNWRKSNGAKRSLGWIPLKTGSARWKNGCVYHNGTYFKVWDSFGLSQYKFRSASFNEDARGRWYFNVVISVECEQSQGKSAVGIDLGCKESALDSNGDGIQGREYRKLEQQLGIAQRANKKARVKAIHAKIKNRRQDAIHKYSRKLVDRNAAIFVGNVNSTSLIKTKMAKSVLDAGWGMLKTTLEYKCAQAGVVFEEVNEAYSTQTCSHCGTISSSSPKGRADLRIREWSCSECGAEHQRDINAAKKHSRGGASPSRW